MYKLLTCTKDVARTATGYQKMIFEVTVDRGKMERLLIGLGTMKPAQNGDTEQSDRSEFASKKQVWCVKYLYLKRISLPSSWSPTSE